MRAEPLTRFVQRVDAQPGGCWLWDGCTNGSGYGTFNVDGRWTMAHRYAYELVHGPIPAGHYVHHRCAVRRCVNPDHLQAVTPVENHRLGRSAEVTGARNRAKTKCPAGHPYDEENTYRHPDGRRSCRTCRAAARERHEARQRTTERRAA